jgi:hypothetical protein
MTPSPPSDNVPAQEIEKMAPKQEQLTLHEVLSRSPLNQIQLEPIQVYSPVRKVEL